MHKIRKIGLTKDRRLLYECELYDDDFLATTFVCLISILTCINSTLDFYSYPNIFQSSPPQLMAYHHPPPYQIQKPRSFKSLFPLSLSLTSHNQYTHKSYQLHPKNIPWIHSLLSISTALLIAQGTIISGLYHCKNILTGLPTSTLAQTSQDCNHFRAFTLWILLKVTFSWSRHGLLLVV